MRPLARGFAIALIAIVAIACGGGGATNAPASAAASPTAGSSAPAGTGLTVVAKDLAFDTTALTAKADTAFTIDFDNQDSAPHNIAIKDATGAAQFKGEVFPGPAKKTYDVPALKAGSYTFWCEVHPNMTGTLTVQ
jgi:plastocyanin